jgi:hypothetical protein
MLSLRDIEDFMAIEAALRKMADGDEPPAETRRGPAVNLSALGAAGACANDDETAMLRRVFRIRRSMKAG